MTRPTMTTDGSDKLRAMRKTPKPVEPAKPAAPVAVVAEKKAPSAPKPKKPKSPKTYADHQAKCAERRESALGAALVLFANQVPSHVTDFLLAAQNKICSYLGSKKWLNDSWNEDGTPKTPVVKPGYRGIYRIRVIPANPGFIGQIFHYSNLGSPKKPKYLPVVDWGTETHVTPEAATRAANDLANGQGVGKRILKNCRTWFAGERDFMADCGSLNDLRQTALDAVHRLCIAETAKNATNNEIDALMAECEKPFQNYVSLMTLHTSWWNSEGVWIGPKKPSHNKPKKATKPPSHYLANFQKAINRGDLEQANSRILHALRNDFPREILTEYVAVAAPFSGQLENYASLVKKIGPETD